MHASYCALQWRNRPESGRDSCEISSHRVPNGPPPHVFRADTILPWCLVWRLRPGGNPGTCTRWQRLFCSPLSLADPLIYLCRMAFRNECKPGDYVPTDVRLHGTGGMRLNTRHKCEPWGCPRGTRWGSVLYCNNWFSSLVSQWK